MTHRVPAAEAGALEWLLLLFFLPSAQSRARLQAWRRLQRSGAVLLNNSGYVIPHSPEAREDFEWIRKEIVASGGQATILVARVPEHPLDDELVAMFRAARRREFQAVIDEATALLARSRSKALNDRRRRMTQQVRRLRERFEAAVRLDFFGTPERDHAGALVARLGREGQEREPMTTDEPVANPSHYQHKRWLTRPRPGVDRMSSAWLIRRFIDPGAQFVFADPAKARGAIAFDTFGAEFGHHGDRCTFETLAARFGLADPAVGQIARIVHDLDLKASPYREPATETIGRLIEGLRQSHNDDGALLKAGMDLFEALYQSLATAPTAAAVRRRMRSRPGKTPRRPPRKRS